MDEPLTNSQKLFTLKTMTAMPMLKCKTALEACGWDVQKAKLWLMEQSRQEMIRTGMILVTRR